MSRQSENDKDVSSQTERKFSEVTGNGNLSTPRGQGQENRTNPRGQGRESRSEVFVISVAAELAGMHAQTLRTYDRIGLVTPQRTGGGGRRYSRDDIDQLREIQRLSHDEGVNLAGIKSIIELQNRVQELEEENAVLREKVRRAEAERDRNHGRSRGEIVHVPRSTAVVMWEPRTRRQRG